MTRFRTLDSPYARHETLQQLLLDRASIHEFSFCLLRQSGAIWLTPFRDRARSEQMPASSPQPLLLRDDDNAKEAAFRTGVEESTILQSMFFPSDEGDQQQQGVQDTYSDLNATDDERNIEDLNDLFVMSATDSESENVDGGEGDRAGLFVDQLQPRHFESRRRRAKRLARDWSSNKFDLPLAKPNSANSARVKTFNYPALVAAAKPKIIPRRTSTGGTDVAASPSASPRRAVTSPGEGARHRRVPANLNPNDIRPARTGKVPTREKVKFVVKNDANDRTWDPHHPPCSHMAPPTCQTDPNAPPRNMPSSKVTVSPFNYDVWNDVAGYLSFQDLKNLRLTCKGFADQIISVMLRSVVTTFGTSMFTTKPQLWDLKSTSLADSMLARFGHEIHKFGISFEYDPFGLMYAKSKVTEKKEHAWFGDYRWPVETYPRFPELQELEDLVDNNRPLLKDSFGLLKGASELALSVDSGHGWLNGPDISDMALFEMRRTQGCKVFGESFQEDIWTTFGRSEWLRWAQENSINASLQALARRSTTTRRMINDLRNMVVREYESFIDEQSQHDFDPFMHAGGQFIPQPAQPAHPAQHAGLPYPPGGLQYQHGAHHANAQAAAHAGPAFAHGPPQGGMLQRLRPGPRRQRNDDGGNQYTNSRGSPQIPLQWPIIFNGFNLAADVGGCKTWIQSMTADPANYPYIPGHLTEAQVQWLMETAWAQRAFLSAYTTAVITNKQTLSQVHTLTLAKISSGLLPSLAQKEFWASLSGLKRLKILVSPDWRNEHVPGDKFFATHMATPPVLAASKFAEFLRRYVSKLERLSHLTIGYIGGGENATGMFARNQHLLPAPVTEAPHLWITDHVKTPDPTSLFMFNHIRDLTFENCWFSSCMLETFMEKSRDTSLHTLTLDSVSMLSRHATGINGGPTTVGNGLHCKHDETEWLQEEVPSAATWTDVLDKITPDITMQERKYAAGMKIDKDLDPAPTKEFRGNVQKIILKSCGYAKISGVNGNEYNQNALVVHSSVAMDEGLKVRKNLFDQWSGHLTSFDYEDPNANWSALYGMGGGPGGRYLPKQLHVMLSMKDPATAEEWFGLGTLTQCVHPIEERILEKAWGFKFGWGDNIERWAAVEDGFFASGTGRFSGVIKKKGCDDGLPNGA